MPRRCGARSSRSPCACRSRAARVDPLRDHALAGVELAQDVLLHGLIVTGGLGASGATPDIRSSLIDVDELEFEQCVDEAVASLPADLADAMSNVAIVVEDEPPPGM